MTRDETIAAIAVMQAFVDGKVIECRNGATGNWWCIKPDPDGWKMAWDFSVNSYRIKPEPRVIFHTIHDDGTVGALAFDSEKSIQEYMNGQYGKGWASYSKFIEVLD